jgi:hypothetical protein
MPDTAPAATGNSFDAVVAANIAAAQATAPAPAASNVVPITQPAQQQAPAFDPDPLMQSAVGGEPAEPGAEPSIDDLLAPQDPNTQRMVNGVPAEQLLGALEQTGVAIELNEDGKPCVRIPIGPQQRNPDGTFSASQEQLFPLENMRDGVMMHAHFTRGTQQNAQVAQQLDQQRAQLNQIQDAMMNPEKFPGYIENMGLQDAASAAFTKSWGTPDKPNVAGFIESMYEMGFEGLFRQAVKAEHARWTGEIKRRTPKIYGDNNDPQVQQALQSAYAEGVRLAQEREAEIDAAMRERIQSRKARNKIESDQRRAKAREELAQRNQQQQLQPQVQQQANRIDPMRATVFAQMGVPDEPLYQKWFKAHLGAQADFHKSRGEGFELDALVKKAALATAQDYRSAVGRAGGAQPRPAQQQQPQRQAPPAMAARVAPAPGQVVSNTNRLHSGRRLDDFDARINQLNSHRRP